MPNWKKVIVSGSDAALTSVTATAGFTGSLLGTASYALTASYTPSASLSDRATRLDLIALNQTGGTLAKGTVVRIPAATNSSDTPRIVTASYESDATSAATLGITAEAILNGDTGSVVLEGILTGINTTGWSTGTLLFLGTGGAITTTPPTSPNHGVRLGQVIREQSSNGSIYVTVDNGAELGELHDVLDSNYGTTTNYGDLLVRSGSVWINSKQMTGSYGLTGSLAVNGPLYFASDAAGSNGLSFIRNGSNNWTWATSGIGNVMTIVGNSIGLPQVVTTSNGLNVTPGGNSTTYGLIITSGSYPAATLLRAGVNTLVVTGSRVGIGTTTPSASLNVVGTTLLSGSSNTISGSVLTVYGSGSLPVFTVQGSQGELFSVTDSLSGSLYSVNDISGLPILEVFSDNTILMGNYQDPMLVTTAKLVTTASGAFVLYSLPTASYDTAYFDYSIKSGSNARAGSIMAIQLGTSVNYTETTTTDFGTTSGVTFGVQVSGSNMILTGSATTSGWTIKTIVRGI